MDVNNNVLEGHGVNARRAGSRRFWKNVPLLKKPGPPPFPWCVGDGEGEENKSCCSVEEGRALLFFPLPLSHPPPPFYNLRGGPESLAPVPVSVLSSGARHCSLRRRVLSSRGRQRMAGTNPRSGDLSGCRGEGVEANGPAVEPQKLIIDTDPGIDDSMTILMAFQMPELEILGLTTIFGNAHTEAATRNALLLCEIAGYPDVPVAGGSQEPLKGGKPCVADFVHGSDGLGNVFLPPPKGHKIEKIASEFLVDKVSEYPGSVSILALGPLTNLALAIKRDSSFASKVKRIVILGGAFFSAGNVNPAAEANIYGDPEAADIVFTSGADIVVVGINITTQVALTDDDLAELRRSKGKHSQFICDICQFYRDWHAKSDGVHGIFLHDPVCFAALARPDLFTFKRGVVRVETQGICVGHTLMDHGLKKWNTSNPWTGYSPVSVAWTVDVPRVLSFIKNLLMKP